MPVKDTIVSFLANLGSKKPAPGGGSASALAGALSAALVKKVAAIAGGKECERRARRAEKKLAELTELIEEDAKAYTNVVKTKGSAPAIKKAAEVPLETAKASLKMLKAAVWLSENGKQNLRSDAFCAIELATAAIYGALENVRANIPYIKNEKLVEELQDEIEKILDICQPLVKP